MPYTPPKEKPIPCRKIRDSVILVQVSTRKFRFAQRYSSGGYSNGYMNLNRYEFISEPLTYSEAFDWLKENDNFSIPSTFPEES